MHLKIQLDHPEKLQVKCMYLLGEVLCQLNKTLRMKPI